MLYTCIILWSFGCLFVLGCPSVVYCFRLVIHRAGLASRFFARENISKNMLAAGLMSRYTSLPVPPFGSHEKPMNGQNCLRKTAAIVEAHN